MGMAQVISGHGPLAATFTNSCHVRLQENDLQISMGRKIGNYSDSRKPIDHVGEGRIAEILSDNYWKEIALPPEQNLRRDRSAANLALSSATFGSR